jgi:hypothetical protein
VNLRRRIRIETGTVGQTCEAPPPTPDEILDNGYVSDVNKHRRMVDPEVEKRHGIRLVHPAPHRSVKPEDQVFRSFALDVPRVRQKTHNSGKGRGNCPDIENAIGWSADPLRNRSGATLSAAKSLGVNVKDDASLFRDAGVHIATMSQHG